MKITRSDQSHLVIVDFPYLIGVIAFPAAAFMLAVTIRAIANHSSAGDIVGPIIGALMFFFGGVVFTKRSEFDFDLVARKLTWRRRGLFTNIGGIVPLDEIRCATVQSRNDGDSGLTYRVVLLLTRSGDRSEIPLTEPYDGNGLRAEKVRSAINQALQIKLGPNQQMENDILELALAGRKIDAIALARTRYGYNLTQAKEFVEGLTT
jgi:hypothetical protein